MVAFSVGLWWLIQDTQVRMYGRHLCSSWWLGRKGKEDLVISLNEYTY